ncbi:hypothetical protein XELAEV_18009056mg [Xenopus laevis]|uniref:Uncharacterized protein n=1 Tax=Xenopus laevis TaxID=8355 RepID=A0A974DSX4_XENLA|nr:hypothetical protein XELAEV_18009056mg [Xenopus laevis]
MEKFLGQSSTKSQRQIKQKLKDKKSAQESDPMDSETETPPKQLQAETLMKVLHPWLYQKLDGIKESVTEILQQITNQIQRITDAEQRFSTLEDELEKTQQLVDTQQRVLY